MIQAPAGETTCFICQKHAGQVAAPPGGYIYQDVHWKVCHAPAAMAHLGTLIVESTRHYLDFGEMSPDEATSYGHLLQTLYTLLKQYAEAERVYTLVTLEGADHFHTWLVPRTGAHTERGVQLLRQSASCDETDAQSLAIQLREAFSAQPTQAL
jgi:diadenosine tetraphosphate (Ap4A) HIT family hydrolase